MIYSSLVSVAQRGVFGAMVGLSFAWALTEVVQYKHYFTLSVSYNKGKIGFVALKGYDLCKIPLKDFSSVKYHWKLAPW